MTCIVGVLGEKDIFIGGDAASGDPDHYSIKICKTPKVFKTEIISKRNKIKIPMLIGYTTSFRMGQLLQYSLVPPEWPDRMESERYFATIFIDHVRKLFQEKGFIRKDKDQESGGNFLLAVKGGLFNIEDDFKVHQVVENYDAIGCGLYLAQGTLYALRQIGPLNSDSVRLALEASAHHNAYVRPPFTILSIPK